MKQRAIYGLLALLAAAAVSVIAYRHISPPLPPPGTHALLATHFTPFQTAVVRDLHRQIAAKIWYQDSYYVGGDPPAHVGVCTDVVIRSYRSAGVDLQRLVAKDIAMNPDAYHISRPDPNIDQRRCKNLSLFFRRKAITLPTQGKNADWQPGDMSFGIHQATTASRIMSA